jgi:cytochrome c
MRYLTIASLALLAACDSAPPRVLLFTKTAGYRHESIATGKSAILELARANRFKVDTTEDASYLTEDSLRHYSAVIFLHTTGELLDRPQQVDLQRFIQAGGGFVGIHAAADAEYDWHWYGRMVGGYFASHPAIQPARLVVDSTHDMTSHLPAVWSRSDEWYNFKRLADDLHVLISIDESSYSGGTNGPSHPVTWFHEYDGGRAWYTALGHTAESWGEPVFLELVRKGIQYAVDGGLPDYSQARDPRVPAHTGIVKSVLTKGTFTEPTEIAVLPNRDVLVIQRRGEVLRYRVQDSSLKQVGLLDVYWKSGVKDVNAEEGLLGLAADPDFARNHYIYLFYSPADSSVNRLSRFTFEGDTLDLSTEKVVLELYSQRQICCHTGGSIAFGPDGLLFVSTGDNSTPFDEPGQRHLNRGFAPIDDRPGHLSYDARRSSANSNDLRGKILRIRIKPDGSYEIPPGNLFPPGTAQTRPEIFVMGNRNPYRISVDSRSGTLYWGEVGPDAEFDSLDTRGPRGYDEVNQARRAGFFGWPLFVGDNYPYRAYDFGTGRSGAPFDAARPVNDSRHNTGLRELPPAQPAFVWYPYHESPDFPQAATGGRTAMAGPVYHADRFTGPGALPRYFDGKLFIYDWIRGWIKAVTLGPDERYEAMESFMDSTKFASPIDLELGPDGALYLLEYGTGWFAKNPDAALSRLGPIP